MLRLSQPAVLTPTQERRSELDHNGDPRSGALLPTVPESRHAELTLLEPVQVLEKA
jgi:hypothetical protein